jgi:hypothetical protein
MPKSMVTLPTLTHVGRLAQLKMAEHLSRTLRSIGQISGASVNCALRQQNLPRRQKETRNCVFITAPRETWMPCMDQLCAHYLTKRKTPRWPLSLFVTFLDITALNTTVMWSKFHPPSASQPSSRRLHRRRRLLIELGQSLTESWMHESATMRQVICHQKVTDAMKRSHGCKGNLISTTSL